MGTKVVLDTNVWVSILLSGSLSEAFVPLIETRAIDVYLSYALLRELARVLTYPRIARLLRAAGVSHQAALASVIRSASLMRPRLSIRTIKEDPADDKVLECAIASGSKVIITGDRHLLGLKEYRGIKILRPKEFLTSNP
jgi:putative PIN family toxin of toxin-antitoxin system